MQNQECHERTGNNEKQAAGEDQPALAGAAMAFAALHRDLQVEDFQQLVWRCLGSFVVVHGLRKKRMFGASQIQKAFLAPFVVFMALLGLGQVVAHFFDGQAFWMASSPQYWVSPVQTVVCGALLLRYWPSYELRAPARPGFTLAIAVLVLAIWVSPQALFHVARAARWFRSGFFGAQRMAVGAPMYRCASSRSVWWS